MLVDAMGTIQESDANGLANAAHADNGNNVAKRYRWVWPDTFYVQRGGMD